MATKSIHDIEINDEAFKRFSELFANYAALLAKTPNQWHQVSQGVTQAAAAAAQVNTAATSAATATAAVGAGAATAATGAAVLNANLTAAATTAATLGTAFHQNNIFLQQSNSYLNQLPAVGRAVASQSTFWASIAKDTKTFAANIGNATTSLLRWASITGVISGLVGGGGLFGIDRLAVAAGDQRRSALGLGVNPGQQSSFGINFGRYVDANRVLGDVNEAQTDVSKSVRLTALGISPNGADGKAKNTADLAAEYLDKLKTLVDKTPFALLRNVLDANQQQNVPTQEAERLRNIPRGEFNLTQQQNRTDAAALALSSGTQKAWSDLQQQLERAGATIEKTLIVGLVGLAGPIGHLSASVTDLIATLSNSPEIKKWLDSIAGGIEIFAKEVGTPEFQRGVESFVSGIDRLGKAIYGFFKWFGGDGSGKDSAHRIAPDRVAPSGGDIAPTLGGWGYNPRTGKWENQKGTEDGASSAPDAPTSAPTGGDDGYKSYGPGQGPFQSPYATQPSGGSTAPSGGPAPDLITPNFIPMSYQRDVVAPATARNPLLQNIAYRPWEQGGGAGFSGFGGRQDVGGFSGAQGIGKTQKGSNVTKAHDFFIAAGWSEEQTAGLLANIGAESGFDPGAQNNMTGSHRGIAQWDARRQEGFRKLFGHTLEQSKNPFEEQLWYIQYELTHGEKSSGDALKRATTAGQAADIVNRQYERSDVGSGQRAADANSYQKQFKGPAVTVHINNSTGGSATVNASQLAI